MITRTPAECRFPSAHVRLGATATSGGLGEPNQLCLRALAMFAPKIQRDSRRSEPRLGMRCEFQTKYIVAL